MSTTLSTYTAAACVDNSLANFCSTGATDVEPSFQAPSAFPLTSVVVYPRTATCPLCPGRMVGSLIDLTAPFMGQTQVIWGTQLNYTAAQSMPHTLKMPAFSVRLSKPAGYAGDEPYANATLSLAEVAAFLPGSAVNLLSNQSCRFRAAAASGSAGGAPARGQPLFFANQACGRGPEGPSPSAHPSAHPSGFGVERWTARGCYPSAGTRRRHCVRNCVGAWRCGRRQWRFPLLRAVIALAQRPSRA